MKKVRWIVKIQTLILELRAIHLWDKTCPNLSAVIFNLKENPYNHNTAGP
jgi:hypothetical protein